jgi:hypothetical protein
MTAALEFLSRITDQIFASQMKHAACRITARHRVFSRSFG